MNLKDRPEVKAFEDLPVVKVKAFEDRPEFKQLTRDLRRKDLLVAVIRGHLFIEFEIQRVLEDFLPRLKAAQLERMNFTRKLELAVALNLVEEEDFPGLRKLNWLRNQFVHNLNFEVTEIHVQDFLACLSGH